MAFIALHMGRGDGSGKNKRIRRGTSARRSVAHDGAVKLKD